MTILSVNNLEKHYFDFHLNNITLTLDQGYIMGLIGSNGSGKTTLLKSILNIVHPDNDRVEIFGKEFIKNESLVKQKIGYMFGGMDSYPRIQLGKLTEMTKKFYLNWDDNLYQYYMKRFCLDPNKRIHELSSGMKINYSLVLALSHHAKLFLFDEPGSGLDPAARDHLLELFQELVESGDKSIIFSTHITSDLEKCADYITYLNNGSLVESSSLQDFINIYRIIKGNKSDFDILSDRLIAYKVNAFGFSGLIRESELTDMPGFLVEKPTLEDIMIYYSLKTKASFYDAGSAPRIVPDVRRNLLR